MNILAAITVLVICVIIGYLMSARVKKTQMQLEQILMMSQKIRAYLKSEKMQTKEIIINLCEDKSLQALSFLPLCKDKFAYNRPFVEIFTESINACENELCLTKEQVKKLNMLGDILGESDAQTQQNALNMFEELLTQDLVVASEESKTKGGLYRSLGVLGGIAFGVLVI